MEIDDKTGTFSFKATLLNGNTAISGYPIDIKDTLLDPDDDDKTGDLGTFEFTLTNYDDSVGPQVLTIPVGARLTVQETGVTGNESGDDINIYDTSAQADLTAGGAYDGNTLYEEDARKFTLYTAPSTALTLTFINGGGGTRKVILRKVNGSYGSLKDAVFDVYKGNNADPFVLKDKENVKPDETLTNLKSKSSGTIWVGELPYGTYYLHEKTVPGSVTQNGTDGWWYYLIVDESGVYEVHDQRHSTREAATSAATTKITQLKEANTNP